VDVQYAGQVIGVNKGPVSAIDSIQLQKNIQELLEKSTIENISDEMLPEQKGASPDTTVKAAPVQAATPPARTAAVPAKANPIPARTRSMPVKTVTNRTSNVSAPVKRENERPKPKSTNRQPKAVMNKRTGR
jgi:cell division protein FtsQ